MWLKWKGIICNVFGLWPRVVPDLNVAFLSYCMLQQHFRGELRYAFLVCSAYRWLSCLVNVEAWATTSVAAKLEQIRTRKRMVNPKFLESKTHKKPYYSKLKLTCVFEYIWNVQTFVHFLMFRQKHEKKRIWKSVQLRN